jgi:hypothetical protein
LIGRRGWKVFHTGQGIVTSGEYGIEVIVKEYEHPEYELLPLYQRESLYTTCTMSTVGINRLEHFSIQDTISTEGLMFTTLSLKSTLTMKHSVQFNSSLFQQGISAAHCDWYEGKPSNA